MAEKRKADAMTTPTATGAAADGPAAKKPHSAGAGAGASFEAQQSLSGFQLTRVLFSDPKSKRLCVLGTFAPSTTAPAAAATTTAAADVKHPTAAVGPPQRAILTFEKPAFLSTRTTAAVTADAADAGAAASGSDAGAAELQALLSGATVLRHEMHNDVYYQFTGTPTSAASGLNALKIDLICPCTDDDIRKKEPSPKRVLRETADDYRAVTAPFIGASLPKGVQWVYNILEKKEVDRLVLEDTRDAAATGFMLSIDMKWDQKSNDALYLVAMPLRRDLHSLRDLNASHIPLLTNIRDQSLAVIAQRWGVPAHSVLAFVHYFPAYYHLHVHFTHASYDSEVTGCRLGRGHLLDDVIANLQLCGTYYRDATLTVVVPAAHGLHDKLAARQPQPPVAAVAAAAAAAAAT